MRRIFPLFALPLILATACSTAGKKPSADKDKHVAAAAAEMTGEAQARPTALTHEQAVIRLHQIAHVSYVLWFGLDKTHDDYEGRTVVNFELRPKAREHGEKLMLDFEEGTIKSLTINGVAQDPKTVDASRFDGHHLYFKLSELQPGTNRIEIAFTHAYSHNGNGLHRFKDPVDGNVYLYSNFEPYNAHRMFPCFDQPDLKASFELTVEAPEDWEVIANTMERDQSTVDGRKSWAFPPSPAIATYVFAMHAGPYVSWKADADGIPVRLFARKSIEQWVDHAEWLDVTKKGLDFYGTQFGYPYPYSKYDQIIVPDFNAGAMENAAAVTFSERYVYRGKVTQDRHRGRADTILHEMAHMWFGDLVTMKWWNGLWLNESFATFMAAWAVDEATSFKGSWLTFFTREKGWGYWEDQLVTTHPIEVPVPHTDYAESNFDGITYGKGAAVLKQLRYFLGEDEFREGVQRYFTRHALRNTTLHDFMKALSEASGQFLEKWQKSWLQTTGVNTLRTEWSCADDDRGRSYLSTLKLIQSPSEGNGELRPHKTEIGLFRRHKAEKESLQVTYSAAETVVRLPEKTVCPDFVFPNYTDQDYVKIELDPASLKIALESTGKIDDPLTRAMVWSTLFEMVVDGKLKAQDYADAVLAQIGAETDIQILTEVLADLANPSGARSPVYVNPRATDESILHFLPPEARSTYRDKLEILAQKQLRSSPAGSDLQLVWFRAYLDAASSTQATEYVRALLTGKQKIKGLKMDEDRRWDLITVLARLGAPDSAELIAAELKADPGDMGEKRSIAAEASLPFPDAKRKWVDQILRAVPASEQLPVAKLREAMRSFNLIGQEDTTRAAADAYFSALPKLASDSDQEWVADFAEDFFPALCDAANVQKVTALLQAHPELPAGMIKALKVNRQEEERCLRARAKASGA